MDPEKKIVIKQVSNLFAFPSNNNYILKDTKFIAHIYFNKPDTYLTNYLPC